MYELGDRDPSEGGWRLIPMWAGTQTKATWADVRAEMLHAIIHSVRGAALDPASVDAALLKALELSTTLRGFVW